MNALRRLLARLGVGSSEESSYPSGDRSLETTDAWAAAHSRDLDPGEWGAAGGGLPPNYVKAYDEGRPRK